jgi:hypothetical protein
MSLHPSPYRHPVYCRDNASCCRSDASGIDGSIGFPKKISKLPPFPKIKDKSPFVRVFVYAARNLSGADRSAPVFKTVIDNDFPLI